MKNDKDLYVRTGFIAGGPPREDLFDSLRLRLPVQFDFILSNKEIIPYYAYVTSIETLPEGLNNKAYGTAWTISLIVSGKSKNKHDLCYNWDGFYSTKTREGIMENDVIPACFIR